MGRNTADVNQVEVARLLKDAIVPMSLENFFPSPEKSDQRFWHKVLHGLVPDKPNERRIRMERLWRKMLDAPGAYIPHANKILIRGDLPKCIFVSTVKHESIHFLKANGVLMRDIPIAAAFGYFSRWDFESRNDKLEGSSYTTEKYLKQENWPAILLNIEEGRRLARSQMASIRIDEILNTYDEIQEEDEASYKWGGVIAGVTIEFNLGVSYLYQLAQGKFHQEAVQHVSGKE